MWRAARELQQVVLGLFAAGFSLGGSGCDRLVLPEMPVVPLAENGGRQLYVARIEVTFADWQQCFDAGGCRFMPKLPAGKSAAEFPVVGVNWFDVSEYLAWINWQTGKNLRLPTLAEWRWIARDSLRNAPPRLFDDPRLSWAANYGSETPVSAELQKSRSFSRSSDGIFDLDGNVWEWTSDCAADGFTAKDRDRCPAYFVGGEHIAAIPVFVRDPASGGCSTGVPPANLGLRLVSDQRGAPSS